MLMNQPPVITFRDAYVRFGDKELFKDLSVDIYERDRICLIGRNGSGKTTLFKAIIENLELDGGEKFVQPNTTIHLLSQSFDDDLNQTALNYVINALKNTDEDLTYKAKQWLDKFGSPYDLVLANASGGELRRVVLAKAFAIEADVLLMDEPTNHLDITTIDLLEKEVSKYPGAIVLISHDRRFLKNVSSKTWWLDKKTILENKKGYEDFETWTSGLLDFETKQIERMDKRLLEETEWLHKGVTARRKRNQGRLARLYELRAQRASVLSGTQKVVMSASREELGGKLVIEAHNISKTFTNPNGGERTIINNFSTKILRGDRIGIFGANGSGKSTLVRLLLKNGLEPDKGRVKIGAQLSIGYFEQDRTSLNSKQTLWDYLCPNGGDHLWVQDRHRHVVAYLKDFLFDPSQARTPIGSLSGGEKNRLALAKILAIKNNVLVLDEPTNDLDVETLDLLVDMLSDYEGTLIVVSHDRDFLDRLVTSTISIDPDGTVIEYAGGYSDFVWQRANGEKPLHSFKNAPQKPSKNDQKTAKSDQKTQISKRKFGFKQQHELKDLTTEIASLTAQKKDIEIKLQDASLYAKDPEHFSHLSSLLEQINDDLPKAEERWLELSMLKEECDDYL